MANISTNKTYIVEHLDPELGPWSALEYEAIARESAAAGSQFMLTSVPESLKLPTTLQDLAGFQADRRGVEEIYAHDKSRVCLLDPAAKVELNPGDAADFDVFLFGGILAYRLRPHVRAEEERIHWTKIGPGTDDHRHGSEVPLNDIPYVDHPELRFDEHESVQMPFRYVVDETSKPIMPQGMIQLIKEDAEKSLDDLF